jgi:hypothetical protein
MPTPLAARELRTSFDKANFVRDSMSKTLSQGEPFSAIVDTNIGACLIGMRARLLAETGVSFLFQQIDEGMSVTATPDDEVIIQNAVRHWHDMGIGGDEVARNRFNITMYLSIYRLVQASLTGLGKQEIKTGMARFFLSVLQEKTEEEFLAGLVSVLNAHGEMPDLDQAAIHTSLTHLWEDIPDEIRQTYGSFNPKNLFTTSDY